MKRVFYSVLVAILAIAVILPTAVLANPCHPIMQIIKTTQDCHGVYKDGADVIAGQQVTWKYEVKNIGESGSYFTNVIVSDSDPSIIIGAPVKTGGDQDNYLEPSETWTYYATGTAVTGAYQNTGTAQGTPGPSNNNQNSDTDNSSYFGGAAGINIVKTTNDQDVPAAPGPTIAVGDPVTWKYTVTNAGNVPLSNITVTDSVSGVTPAYVSGDNNTNSALDLTETWVYTATGIATAGQYHNTGKATGEWVCKNVEATDDSWYYGETPGTPPSTPPEVGGDIYPTNKLVLLMPVILLAFALISVTFIGLKRHQAKK